MVRSFCFQSYPISDDACQAADGIGAAAKAEEEDSVAWAPKPNKRSVTIDDVCRNSKTGGSANQIVNLSSDPTESKAIVSRRSEARIVKGYLFCRIDWRIGAAPCGAE